jgi:bifunctional non-homologous end joining protein LigD
MPRSSADHGRRGQPADDLIRCPQGRAKKCFFQKHDSGTFGPSTSSTSRSRRRRAVEDYLYFDDARGLLACVQMGTIEFHGWGSRVKVENPDRLVFDLDPDVGLDFAKVKARRRCG